MPYKNHFQHQQLSAETPTADWTKLTPTFVPSPKTEAFEKSIEDLLHLACQHVDALWLVHGTFVGNDALGIFGQIERAVPAIGPALKQVGKKITDLVAGDTGNFDERFEEQFAGRCPVNRFTWSGENHHSGRCKAAIELLAQLLDRVETQPRVLLWGHSHAGNIAALVTNLLGADDWCRSSFFELLEPLFPVQHNQPNALQRVRAAFESRRLPGEIKLDVVNFGTPVSYGWDTGGYRRLLHVVNHRPRNGHPQWLSPPLSAAQQWLTGKDDVDSTGDAIQILGISGSEFLPWLLSQSTRDCETALAAFVAPGNTRANYLEHVRLGVRVAREGKTVLVDYSTEMESSKTAFGHAIYTQLEWLGFHCDLVRQTFYQGAAIDGVVNGAINGVIDGAIDRAVE